MPADFKKRHLGKRYAHNRTMLVYTIIDADANTVTISGDWKASVPITLAWSVLHERYHPVPEKPKGRPAVENDGWV